MREKTFPNAKCYAYRIKNKTPLLNPDFSVDKFSTIQNKYSLKLLELNDVKKLEPDLTVIATPTSSHSKFVHDFSKKSKKILVEKPAALNFQQAKLITNINNHCFVSVCFQRLHDPALKKFISFFQEENVCNLKNISVIVGSDVRLWHPYEDFRDLYACRSDLGGGVLYTECHEIAVVLKILGLPSKSKLVDYSMLKGCDVESEIKF